MKFCDQTVAFQTHIFRIFLKCFHYFLSVIFEPAVVREERESGPCIQLAIFNFSYGMPLQQKHLGSVTELANRINE